MCLILFLLVTIYIVKAYSARRVKEIQSGAWVGLLFPPLLLAWLLLCIAETNRTPFDIAEGESEIVSGFNIEYGGGAFALIFIREYGIIIFLSFITALFFWGGANLGPKTLLVCALFVWVRCSFPRVRYDKLMITT